MAKAKTLRSLAFIAITAFFAITATTAMAQSDTEKLVAAIEKMETSQQVYFSGKAEVPETDDDAGMGGVKVIIAGGRGGERAKVYDGNLELSLAPEDGGLLICSEQKLPGIAIYQEGDELIQRTTFQDETFSVDDLGSDLRQLLDFEKLKKYVAKAENIEMSEKDGVASYSCELSKRFIRSAGGTGPAAMFAASIKAIDATFSVDSSGELAGLGVQITRENPMAKMMKMGRGGGVRMMGGNLDELGPEMKAQVKKQLGGDDLVVVYSLKRKEKPSERTQAVLKELQSLIEQ